MRHPSTDESDDRELVRRLLRQRRRYGVALIEDEPEVRAVLASLAAAAPTPEGEAHTAALPAYGAAWEWTQAIAPPFPLEGGSLGEFLAWVSRESGRRIAGPAVATGEAARATVLHGSLAGLTPEESLAAVLPSCGLGFRLDGATIRIAPEGGR